LLITTQPCTIAQQLSASGLESFFQLIGFVTKDSQQFGIADYSQFIEPLRFTTPKYFILEHLNAPICANLQFCYLHGFG
jgi:hypothetical protein